MANPTPSSIVSHIIEKLSEEEFCQCVNQEISNSIVNEFFMVKKYHDETLRANAEYLLHSIAVERSTPKEPEILKYQNFRIKNDGRLYWDSTFNGEIVAEFRTDKDKEGVWKWDSIGAEWFQTHGTSQTPSEVRSAIQYLL